MKKYLRNFIFGVEDSLVSTVGMLSGIASAGVAKENIFIAGIVLIFVEAFSMGIGSYLSESFTEKSRKSAVGGVVMLFSYFFAGFIPLSPYLFLPISQAFWISIALSLIALLALGFISAKISKLDPISQSLKMLTLGGLAIIIGVVVGKIMHY